MVMLGANGSWRWSTSKSPRRSARTVRTAAAGWGAMGATDPFTRKRNARPALVPRRSPGSSPGATISMSCPRPASARARPTTWSCTPPGADRLYGHTRAKRTCSPDTCRRRPRGQMSAPRARSPSPTTRTFARSSGPKRSSSSGVIAVRNVPKARSASGSRKLRLVPSATWWM